MSEEPLSSHPFGGGDVRVLSVNLPRSLAAFLLLQTLIFPARSLAGSSAATAATTSSAAKAATATGFGQFPLYFEPNRGQADSSVRFLARGREQGIYLTADGLLLDLAVAHSAKTPTGTNAVATTERVLRISFPGAESSSVLAGLEPTPGQVNYLIGREPSAWLQQVPTFSRVRWAGLYPGIDLIYYGQARQLEFDFVLAPGAEPSRIELRVEGADRVEIDGAGDLVLHLGSQHVRQHRPVAYQEMDGARRSVPAQYVMHGGGTVGLSVGHFDRRRPLVIDPVLSYSTFFGGSKQDGGWAIAVDGAGSAYIAGDTRSTFKKLPPNGYQTNFAGGTKYGGDAFVAKLDPSGSNLVYLTYLGGSELDSAQGIAVDNTGCAYITGYTDSTNFPTSVGVIQPEIGGTNDPVFKVHPPDAFITKLDASGANLMYSTYLGGESADSGTDITVDASGFAYVVGYTESAVLYQTTNIVCTNQVSGMLTNVICAEVVVTNRFPTNVATALTAGFPITNAVQANNRGAADLFVSKLTPDGSALVFSTYLGGALGDFGTGIAIDGAGDVAVCGWTVSPDLPVTNAIQPRLGGARDAFAAKLDFTGSSLVYLTYLGGARDDLTYDLAMDAGGSVYVAGLTASTDFLSTPGSGRLSGGVFRSLDGAGSWSLMSSGLTHTITHALWADSTAAGLVYAGTPRGVFKTLDGGLNWSSSSTGLVTLNVNTIIAEPTAPSILWAGTAAGIFRSPDAGQTWTNETVNLGVPVVRALLFEPGNADVFYVGSSSGVYKSYDHGTNWAKANKGLDNKVVQALAVLPSSPALLYAATAGGIFVSTNAGTNWKSSNKGLSTKNTRALAIDPTNPQLLYAGTAKGIYKSSNAATNWTIVTNGLGKPPINALLLDPVTPTTLYAGTTNGIFKSVDAGGNWSPSQTNLTSPDVTALAFDAASVSTIYAGTRGTNFVGGTNDAFLVKLVPDGRALAYAFTFGGKKNDEAWDVAVDSSGNAYVTGQTGSKDFPIAGAVAGQSNFVGKIDAWVAEFDPTGRTNLYSIFVGGKGADFGQGIAVDGTGGVYVIGRTASGGFTTTNALQPTISSDHNDIFVLKLVPGPSLSATLAGENMILQWNPDSGEYVLEAFDPALRRWAPVPQRPVVQPGKATVTLPAAASVRWFRLRQAGP